jgi:predicted PurR-regulated permease PerM
VVLFLVMLYEMNTPPREEVFLTPPLVGLAGVVLLWPLRRHKAVRALLLSGGLLLLLWTLDKVSRVLVPFGAVYLLAYLLNPLVKRLERRYRVPRWLPSLVITGLVVGAFMLFVLILAPNIANQAQALSERVLGTVQHLRTWLEASTVLDTLESAGILNKQQVIEQMQALVKNQASELPGALENLASSLGSFLGIVTLLALVPVILFYTLKDYPTIQTALVDLFPTAGGRRDYLVEAGSIVGRYFRGQLLISTIAAVNVSVLLFLFNIPFWLLIGLLAGLLNLIPQIGALITMVVGALVALVLGSWAKALIVIAVLLGESVLEQSVLTPNILSYQVGLHPLLVLFSLLVFGTLLGIFGLLIAVPVTTILVTGYRAYREELTLDLSEYVT